MIRRVEPSDVFRHEGEALLLFDQRVVRVGPVGLALFDAAANPTTSTALARTLGERFGQPPGTSLDEATARAIEAMLAEGVLTEDDPHG